MSKKEKGRFGNVAGGLYTPMSETEQEVLHRLVENQNLVVHVLGHGSVAAPKVIVGDLRLGISFRFTFEAPEVPTPYHFLDLELRTLSGLLLFKERQSAIYNGQPLSIAEGVYLDMVWDIAITAIDPKVVKHILPSAIGLTSRFQDKDTGDLTLFGNQKMNSADRNALIGLRKNEAQGRADTAAQTKKAEKLAKKP